MVVLVGSLAIMVLAIVFWPVAALVRRHYGRKLNLTRRERRLRIATRLVCLVDLIFVGSFVGLANVLDDPGALNSHLDLKLHLLQGVGLLGAVGTIAVIYNALQVWRTAPARAAVPGDSVAVPLSSSVQSRTWVSRIFETLIGLACLGLVWFEVYWNVLNFNFNY